MARFANGNQFFLVMSRVEVDWFRKRSSAAEYGAWVIDYDAMRRKTVIRRTEPYLPKSTEMGTVFAADAHTVFTIFERPLPASPTLDEAEYWPDRHRQISHARLDGRYLPVEPIDELSPVPTSYIQSLDGDDHCRCDARRALTDSWALGRAPDALVPPEDWVRGHRPSERGGSPSLRPARFIKSADDASTLPIVTDGLD